MRGLFSGSQCTFCPLNSRRQHKFQFVRILRVWKRGLRLFHIKYPMTLFEGQMAFGWQKRFCVDKSPRCPYFIKVFEKDRFLHSWHVSSFHYQCLSFRSVGRTFIASSSCFFSSTGRHGRMADVIWGRTNSKMMLWSVIINKAVYTTASVEYGWAWAVTQVLLPFGVFSWRTDQRTNGRSDL